MNPQMRRMDRMLSEDEAVEILKKGSCGVLSTISDNGYPYGVPVSYVFYNGYVYFHCAANAGHKLKNIASNPNVCFTVVGKNNVLPSKFTTDYESVIVFGKAEKISGDKKYAVLESLLDKYAPDFKENGLTYIAASSDMTDIIGITPEQITGKAND